MNILVPVRGNDETMRRHMNLIQNLAIVRDTKGQDLIEYALMAGFVALSSGVLLPDVANGIGSVFHKVSSVLLSAASPMVGSGVI